MFFKVLYAVFRMYYALKEIRTRRLVNGNR